VAHALAVAAAYCAAVALLCSSSAVEYNQPDVALGIGAFVAFLALHIPLGYLAQGRWSYPICAFPAVWAAITRGDEVVGDVTNYGLGTRDRVGGGRPPDRSRPGRGGPKDAPEAVSQGKGRVLATVRTWLG